ncbi:tyrosine-protein phosphatase MSG5 [Paracoccidioides lutzii Pb01]|uniref:protein-tyrosine-phosphatase n=1 Tax=Paracoccidioides lutzii (strain ATCC MYA-826 / Pb01) TaxID=502779 RepID=C1H8D6_PARBA|nr:tyrosine-protein phosphatase MSG5 [Paracoccidioides lutzii Pb01]EEH36514.1 tyrosine-protein phosphatase MSG5 [Paracoccidioides lutzii Pb01]
MIPSRDRNKSVNDNNYLKRSFAQVEDPKSLYPHDVQCDIHNTAMSIQMLNEFNNNLPRIAPTNRRSRSHSRSEISTLPNSPCLSSSFPAFMATTLAAVDGSSFHYTDEKKDSCLGPRKIMDIRRTVAAATLTSPNTASTSASSISAVTTTNTTLAHGLSRPHTAVGSSLTAQQVPIRFLRRESLSVASGSADSSPTTTISTFDSPVVLDPSPSSSPESPSSVLPLPSLKPISRLTNDDRLPVQLQTESRMKSPPSLAAHSQYQFPPESPTRRARNLKNLSLKLPPISSSRQTIATAPIRDPPHNISAPSSPIQPNSRNLRRKAPNLTIQTPSFDRSFSSNIAEVVPPTPNTRPTLRHIESSPSLNSIFSPTAPSKPSLALPGLFFQSSKRPMPGTWEDRIFPDRPSFSTQPSFQSREALHELVEEDDPPISRESCKGSDKGYPDGPILIYDSGLYLYLEPSCEEAMKFDVVINVAKEVANPFEKAELKQNTVVSVWKATLPDAQRRQSSVVEPDTAHSEISFKSAFEFQPVEVESPSTPKPNSPEQPEYIHVPWDHNSEILDDLYPLCKLIDSRISQGKKVLIHCQLGVSRSASLVIAYGLYKNPDKDFNAMYSIVKSRSCWVGPNMSLIYQLTDFRLRVQECSGSGGGGGSGGWVSFRRSPREEWFNNSSSRSIKMTEQPTPPEFSSSISTAPKLARPPIPLFHQAAGDPKQNSPTTHSFTNHFTGSATTQLKPQPSKQRRNPSPSPRPLPLREKYQTFHSLSRPRYESTTTSTTTTSTTATTTTTTTTTIPSYRTIPRSSTVQMDQVMQDDNIPTTPFLFSPRAAEFWRTPFARTDAGDLAFHDSSPLSGTGAVSSPRVSMELMSPTFPPLGFVRPVVGSPLVAGMADPRSPPQQRREPVFMRNIDEFL